MKFFAINYCRLQDYLYLCIVFFMVLDLRLVKIGCRETINFFFALCFSLRPMTGGSGRMGCFRRVGCLEDKQPDDSTDEKQQNWIRFSYFGKVECTQEHCYAGTESKWIFCW